MFEDIKINIKIKKRIKSWKFCHLFDKLAFFPPDLLIPWGISWGKRESLSLTWMAKIRAMATNDFCPPLNWSISLISEFFPVKLTAQDTPVAFSNLEACEKINSLVVPMEKNKMRFYFFHTWSSSLSSLFMERVPLPPGTNFSKTSWKYFETCLKVNRIASNFLCSSTSIRSIIFLWPLSTWYLWQHSR